jgi:hypothetical protein
VFGYGLEVIEVIRMNLCNLDAWEFCYLGLVRSVRCSYVFKNRIRRENVNLKMKIIAVINIINVFYSSSTIRYITVCPA